MGCNFTPVDITAATTLSFKSYNPRVIFTPRFCQYMDNIQEETLETKKSARMDMFCIYHTVVQIAAKVSETRPCPNCTAISVNQVKENRMMAAIGPYFARMCKYCSNNNTRMPTVGISFNITAHILQNFISASVGCRWNVSAQ